MRHGTCSIQRMRTIFPIVASLAAFSAAIYGCSNQDDEADDGAAAVVGGKLDTKHTFAVGILAGKARCSGVLIAENVVLTARHCVSDSSGVAEVKGNAMVDCDTARFVGGSVPESKVSVTTDSKLPGKKSHKVAKIIFPTDNHACGNDIAALILEDNVSSKEAEPATPLIRSPLTDSKKVGKTIAAIGFGDQGPDKTPIKPTRQIREDIAISCIPGDSKRDCGEGAPPREFRTEGFVCSGDSGSGAFVQQSLDKKPLVIGVLSMSAADCSRGIYTRTDTSANLIVTATALGAAYGHYRLPAWMTSDGEEGDYVDAGDVKDIDEDGGLGVDDVDGGSGNVDSDGGTIKDDQGPADDEGGGWEDWIAKGVKLLEKLQGVIGELPKIAGADKAPPKTRDDVAADGSDAGSVQDAGAITDNSPSDDVTPAGGDRTTPLSDDSDDSSNNDDGNDDDKSAETEKKPKAKSSGCSASPSSTTGFGGAGALAGLALVAGAIRRRNRRV